MVIGVSRDSVASHRRFKKKYDLPFMLLSDSDGEVCAKYDVIKEKMMYGKKRKGIERSTFIIDESGTLRHAHRGVKVEGHIRAILAEL